MRALLIFQNRAHPREAKRRTGEPFAESREWPSTVAKRRSGAGSVSYLQLQAPRGNMPSKPEQAETGKRDERRLRRVSSWESQIRSGDSKAADEAKN